MSKYLIYITLLFQTVLLGQNTEMEMVRGGSFMPLYGTDKPVRVESFLMDKYPVTNKEFLEFVEEHSKWQKTQVIKLFADKNYLSSWEDDTVLGEGQAPTAPVTNVSWYAAKEYCECQGKRLPTTKEWEYAAMAGKNMRNGRKLESYTQNILRWYETPDTYDDLVGSTFSNYWGIYDMHGLVWEWTSDFNSVMTTGESRTGNVGNSNLFCGAAALGASDLMNYAAFLRYAFRGSLEANYTIRSLGFRCVKDVEPKLFASNDTNLN